MSGFWDWFKREIVDGGVGARQPMAHVFPEFGKAFQEVENAREFFEKVEQETLYYRYRSGNARPFDVLAPYLAETKASAGRILRRIQRNEDVQRERLTLNQPAFVRIEMKHFQKDLKKEMVYAVYSLERFHDQLQSLEGYDDHKEGLRRFLDSLEPFVARGLSEEGGGKLGNRNSYLLMQRLREEYEKDWEETLEKMRKRTRERKRERQEYQPKIRHQGSKNQQPDTGQAGDNNEQLERLEQSNREIHKELQEANEARDRAERREILKRHPKWWWWLP